MMTFFHEVKHHFYLSIASLDAFLVEDLSDQIDAIKSIYFVKFINAPALKEFLPFQ